MRIGIVGLGYVGLTLAIAAASHGIDVYGKEINPWIKECLSKGKAHFFEPGLDELIGECQGKTFHVCDEFPKDMEFDAFVITVGTPLKKGSKDPNFDYIKSALESICSTYDGSQCVILRSTVSVGTTRKIVMPFLTEMLGVSDNDVYVSMCPERTVEGKAIEELQHLPQVVSGNNETALEIAKKLFLSITDSVVEADSLEEAEIIKLYCNVYRDVHFSIGNAFCLAAQKFGLDGMSAIRKANEGYNRASIPSPGFVAGPCLEKDGYILTCNMKDGLDRDFIMAGRHINEYLEEAVVQWVEKYIKDKQKEKIVLTGMAFKGKPETSDLRGSSSVNIAVKLKQKGYEIRLHDFVAYKDEMEALKVGKVFTDLGDACKGATAVLILNDHPKYEELPLDEFSLEANGTLRIMDAWGACSALKKQTVFKVDTLGTMLIEKEAVEL